MPDSLSVAALRPGRVDYDVALRWQRETAGALRAGRGGEAVALLEHPPVYTLGRRADRANVLRSQVEIEAAGARVVATDRGGDVTFHGPGQLVGYPILDLRARGLGAVDYVRALEHALVATLASFGVEGGPVAGRPGVWVDGAKVAAIGVRVQRAVSTHGFALNVRTDLDWFRAIVPCGLSDAGTTSIEALRSVAPPMAEVEDAVIGSLRAALGLSLVEGGERIGEFAGVR